MKPEKELELLKEFVTANIYCSKDGARSRWLEYVNMLDNVSDECAEYIRELLKGDGDENNFRKI